MFGLVSQRAYDSLAEDLECERVHFKKEIEYAHKVNGTNKAMSDLYRKEIKHLKEANKNLVDTQDRLRLDLIARDQEIQGLRLKVQSLEARWGKEATI